MVNWKEVEYARPIGWATQLGLMAAGEGKTQIDAPTLYYHNSGDPSAKLDSNATSKCAQLQGWFLLYG